MKPGEMLGFAGLMGSGRTEILETLFGRRRMQGGSVKLRGAQVALKNTQDAIKAGFALIPEDRRKQGLVLIHTVKENAILPKVSRLCKSKVF
ncbi:ATP-binding cassette domain-containing protein, partial [Bifidobacterium thermophilum]|nr:ATP-binding cassette domain-containing protein [Bifidobacterium thermophilum]